ncbi:unnamed protein product (macronuclear) [Paramecium tetraurelia]|uniref:Uncharacterized protein n=1 Tax=Paramecium tetraurelia TaxID=5888 RepID=A0DW99_PARTE|nr:uncharacterized protein GSPATT00020958001 [Paramecium tetraurelia]CAK87316.1 unnamed protein product [Paramecium tetraurelia]|eukprot:XP_001454713.1 hypothetical protein (macronuclear) [Paramecium tetraurelia strain d4-2]
MQNILLPYSKELQKLETRIENKVQSGVYSNPLQEQMQRAKLNIIRLESIHLKKKKLSSNYNEKLQKLNEKLSNQMETSQQKKEEKLNALQNKLKKLNQPKKPLQMSFQEETSNRQSESPIKKEILQTPQNKAVQKQEIHEHKIQKIKLAEPKKVNENELFDQLNRSMDAAKQRKSERIDIIKKKLHGQDEIVHQHMEKSQKNKEELEQQRLNQIYQKLLHLAQRTQEKQMKQQSKERRKSMHQELSNSGSQNKYKELKQQDSKAESIRTARSVQNDYKFIQVRQRLEKLNIEREMQAQSILDKHQQYSTRIQQNKQLLDELANTCQYYNFKIKEQYLL